MEIKKERENQEEATIQLNDTQRLLQRDGMLQVVLHLENRKINIIAQLSKTMKI